MNRHSIFTQRFVLKKMGDDGYDRYYALSTNENVMRFVTGYPLDRHESNEMYFDILNDPESIGYLGKYFIEDRKKGTLIGMVKIEKYGNEIEIGYRILEAYWGLGVATEVTRALILFSILKLETKTVCAFVDIRNKASVRVLEKSGMINEETIEDLGEPRYKFSYTLRGPLHKLRLWYIYLTR